MAKSKRRWVGMAVMAAGALGVFHLGSALFSSDEAGDHLANQFWIGKLPKTDREIVPHAVLLDHDGGRFGVWGDSSTWKHDFEIFKWAREDDRLLLFFPQTRKRAKGKVRVWKCEGEAPKPFQLCLEITHEGRKRLYYSREDWVIEPDNTAESLRDIAEDTPELEGFVDAIDGDLE